jgi:hypothetical protein
VQQQTASACRRRPKPVGTDRRTMVVRCPIAAARCTVAHRVAPWWNALRYTLECAAPHLHEPKSIKMYWRRLMKPSRSTIRLSGLTSRWHTLRAIGHAAVAHRRLRNVRHRRPNARGTDVEEQNRR